MSALSLQAKELRETADKLQEHGTFVVYGGNVSCDTLMHDAAFMMREAADTIESLRRGLQKEGDALRDYRASQIAAEAERRLHESYGQVPEQVKREDGRERESYGKRTRDSINDLMTRKDGGKSRYTALFGTPERAARTLIVVRKECEDIGTCYPNCPFVDAPACPSGVEPRDRDALLEWLRGESDEA